MAGGVYVRLGVFFCTPNLVLKIKHLMFINGSCIKIILKLLFHLKKMELHNLFSVLFVISLSPLTRSPAFMPALPHSHKHYALTCEKEQAL